MGRPRLELACSVCKRTPDEVRILSNRYCTDCMSEYNKEQRRLRLKETKTATVQMIMDETEEWIWEDGHWQEYEKPLHGPKRNVKHVEFEDMH